MKWQIGCATMQTHHPPMKEDRKYHLLSDLQEISGENGAKTFHMIMSSSHRGLHFFRRKSAFRSSLRVAPGIQERMSYVQSWLKNPNWLL